MAVVLPDGGSVPPRSKEHLQVEITIGIRDVARELTIETTSDTKSITKSVTDAVASGAPLVLSDARGGQVIVPSAALGYVSLGTEEPRRVGFDV